MSSRERILAKLRAAQKPFTDLPARAEYLHIKPLADTSPAGLLKSFVEEATKLACKVQTFDDDEAALEHILQIIGKDEAILTWDYAHISLPGLPTALSKVRRAELRDSSVRVGLTGVEAGLAATGSLLFMAGEGKPRQASLLSPVHIAVVNASQIVLDLETWIQGQKAQGLAAFRRSSNNYLVSGPSRTADIAMESIMGVHGPGEVQVVVLTHK